MSNNLKIKTMKKIYLSIVLFLIINMTQAQCLVTVNGTNILCNGQCNGTATANAVGVPPINYLWSGGQTTATITGLCAGTYTVNIVDGSSCTSSATVTIVEPAALVATSTTTNITCNGLCNGTATAFVSGGTGGYTHKWNTVPVQTSATANSLCVGAYYDTIKDANNCSFVLGPVSITQPAALMAIVTCSSVSCFGGSNGMASASQTGGTASYTYSWNTIPVQTTASITGLSPGMYSCTITDANNCTSSNSCTVNQPSTALSVNTTSSNASCATCCDGSANSTVSGGTSGYTYVWSPGAQTTANITAVCPGNYTVCVTDAAGCTECSTVSVNFTVGINEHTNAGFVHVFPNPASDLITIQMELNNSLKNEYYISNVLGEKIYNENLSVSKNATVNINISKYSSGIYFVTLKNENGTSVSRFIKQ